MDNLKKFYSIFIISIFLLIFFNINYEKKPTTCIIHLPESLPLNFYHEGNQTIDFQFDFNMYWVMISGETEKESYMNNFQDETLLSYMMDVWNGHTLNETDLRLHPEFYLNGEDLILEFDSTWDTFNIQAFDLSIINDTNYCNSFDFGNDIFISIDTFDNEIYLKQINCYKISGTQDYVPFIVLENNGQLFEEKMAWNNTIDINFNIH